MLIAIFVAILFGGGSLEVFFIDEIEKGVNKYVTDKDRKKELQAHFKDYHKTYKNWNKEMQKDLKEFKKQNLDRTLSLSWYEEFFDNRLEQTAEIQADFIDYRIVLQNEINDDEWSQIMELATSAERKEQAKEEKAARKKSDKDLMHNLKKAGNENILDPDSKKEILDAWHILKENYDGTIETYDNINVEDNQALVNKNLSVEEMKEIVVKLDSLRSRLYKAYINYLGVLKDNTSNEEYHSIMNEFNKLLEY